MVRTRTVDKNGIIRGEWSEEQDNILTSFVVKHGGRVNWRQLPRLTGLKRCGKSCRLRWKNYLNPDVKKGNYTDEEVEQIKKLHEEHGNKWSLIAKTLPGRTDNEVKNFWNTHLKKHAKQDRQSINSTCEDMENLDEMDQVSVLMSTGQSCENLDSMDSTDSFQGQFEGILQDPFLFDTSNDVNAQFTGYDLWMPESRSIQIKEFDFTDVDSFTQVSSMNLDSMDSIQEQFGGISQEPILLNTLNDLTTQFTGYDLFPEVSSIKYNFIDSLQEDFEEIWDEPFLFNTPNNSITQSMGYDLAQIFLTEPFLLDNSCSQFLPYIPALSDESVVETFGHTPLNLDAYNSQYLPSHGSDFSYRTQPFSIHASYEDLVNLDAYNNNEEFTTPFMPLETGDDELLNLQSIVNSFLIDDEDQNNVKFSYIWDI